MGPPPFALVESKVSFLSFAASRKKEEKKKFRRIQTAIRGKMACDPGMEGKIFSSLFLPVFFAACLRRK